MQGNTAGAPWGATVSEWQHFADGLGLQADLLPVVSNPGAVISPKSKMRDLGKTPSRFNQQREAVGIPEWTQHAASDRDVGRWSRDSDLGICLQTRAVRAIDVDIADPVAAQRVLDLLELGAGALPRRRRNNSGKCLLAFSMPGDFTKRVIRTADGIIEFLATGQQFIAVGTHPSGSRYEWVDGDGVLALPAEFPPLTPAEFEVLWQALVEQFALPDGESRLRGGVLPVIPRNADDLRDPVVAFLAENGWVSEYERDGKVHVRCPWEHEHTSDSGPSSTSWFPAGVGGFQQGHFRCLHAHCTSRTDGDFLEAVGYVASDFGVVEAPAPGTEPQPLPPFERDRAGRIEAAINNLLMALRRPDVCGARIGFDEFKATLMICPEGGGAWRAFTDADYVRLRSRLERGGFKALARETVRDAVALVADDNSFDSAKDWGLGLQWDGVPRVSGFFSRYFGVDDSPYSRAVGEYLWSALGGRCVSPGVKADMVPVLVGLQGAGKTSAIEVLAPEHTAFVEINLEQKDDDIARSLRGKLVGEIAELRGLQTRDSDSIKAWVSRRREEWVPKYKEFSAAFDRRLVLLGTGNRGEFLDDETGERRWLPLTVGAVDLAGVARDRDQLWAEGVVLFQRAGVQWQQAQALAADEHAQYKVSDTWQDVIVDWLKRDDMDAVTGAPRWRRPLRLLDVLVSALGFNVQKISRKDELRAGKVLRGLGFEKSVVHAGNDTFKGWRASQKTHAALCPIPVDFCDLA